MENLCISKIYLVSGNSSEVFPLR